MRIAALVKQIPQFETMALGPDGRLQRDGLPLEMNAYCRRAVAKAVELALATPGSSVTVCTLGPPSAEDVLREALAWGLQQGLDSIDALHVSDPAFAGSDTLATAHALAAALGRWGPFDLVLMGRNSVDADTGQVGPQLAELLDLPFLTAVRALTLEGDTITARCELDDGHLDARVALPAILSCAERLCDPSKVDPAGRAAVDAERIHAVDAATLGAGPWGAAASPTWVGDVRVSAVDRERRSWPERPVAEQVAEAVAVLRARGALGASPHAAACRDLPAPRALTGSPVAVLVEPDRARFSGELLGAAAGLAAEIGGHVVALAPAAAADPAALGAAGADMVVALVGGDTEEDLAAAAAQWAGERSPWAVLAPSTTWGREIAGRLAARLGAGLTGDAVELEAHDGRLVAWKPAFGGATLAAIHCRSQVQLATVRAGMLGACTPRAHEALLERLEAPARSRVQVLGRVRDDDLDVLADAEAVVGVGRGVDPADYPQLDPLLQLLDAHIAATRKVTDAGWLPRARQIGITGRSIAPRLYVSVAAGGKFNHSAGFRAAGTVLAINADADAPVFAQADAGIVAPWQEALPYLLAALR